jgi:hypothetical protein
LPPPVTDVHAESITSGSVTISWVPPKADPHTGDAATSYRVYASTNGFGFDGGTNVSGADKKRTTISGLDPKIPHYFKVVAINAGGESEPSEVVAAVPSGGKREVLVVNGFDRLDRTLNPKQTYRGKSIERVWPRQSNSRDYVIQVASAIKAASHGTHIDSTSNEAVESGAVKLTDYKTAVWILGQESTADQTFSKTEQKLVEKFVAGGGNLFVSGSDIARDLDEKRNGREFCAKTLCVKYVSDNAGTYRITGASGTLFDGMSFGFDHSDELYDSEQVYDVNAPDVIAAELGGMIAAHYANDARGAAAIQVPRQSGRGGIVVMGFPFETITTAKDRTEVMKHVLDFFTR